MRAGQRIYRGQRVIRQACGHYTMQSRHDESPREGTFVEWLRGKVCVHCGPPPPWPHEVKPVTDATLAQWGTQVGRVGEGGQPRQSRGERMKTTQHDGGPK